MKTSSTVYVPGQLVRIRADVSEEEVQGNKRDAARLRGQTVTITKISAPDCVAIRTEDGMFDGWYIYTSAIEPQVEDAELAKFFWG